MKVPSLILNLIDSTILYSISTNAATSPTYESAMIPWPEIPATKKFPTPIPNPVIKAWIIHILLAGFCYCYVLGAGCFFSGLGPSSLDKSFD